MKKMYLLLLIVIGLIALSLYSTYAMFTADLNIGEIINLTASNLPTEGYTQEYETVGIDAYQSKTIDLNITNSTSSSIYYGVWYQMVNPSTINSNIKIGLTTNSANPSSGQISASATKTVSICIKNNTNSAVVINIGAGYSDTSSLNLPTDRTLISGTFDNEAPSLSLDKITYLDIPFDNTWTYSEATVDSDGVLSTTKSSGTYAISPYIPVDGEFWYNIFDAYVTNPLANKSTGGVTWETKYFNASYAATKPLGDTYLDSSGIPTNGAAYGRLDLNQWNNSVFWQNLDYWKSIQRYGPNVKYVRLYFRTTENSVAPVKLRNLKVYGQMKNSFYYINIKTSDNVGVTTTKCAQGIHSKEYFKENGTVVNNNQVTVTENGTYTVYVEDAVGNATIDTIEITNINIPSDYQRVEYIKSTGTQYINTGYYWQHENIEIYFDGKVVKNTSAQSLFGNEEYTSSSNTRNFAGIPYGSNGNYSIFLGSGSNGTVSTTVGTRFTLDIKTTTSKNIQVLKDGTEAINKTYTGSVMTHDTAYTNSNVSTTVGNIFIFANHNSSRGENNNATQNVSEMNLYDFKLYDNNVLVRNFTPCYRKSDGVAGLYDTVNGEFYTNQGTGVFGTGENIPAISS